MPLSSSSTLAEVQAAYDDNASYREVGSLLMAAAFASACRILLRRVPKIGTHGRQSMEFSPEIIRAELLDATRWINTSSAGQSAPVLCPGLDYRG